MCKAGAAWAFFAKNHLWTYLASPLDAPGAKTPIFSLFFTIFATGMGVGTPVLATLGPARGKVSALPPQTTLFLVGTTRGPRHESECSLSSRNAWLHKIQIKYTLGAGPLNDEGHAANKSKEGQQASENGSRRRFPRSPVRGCGGSGWGGCLGWAPPPGH